MRLRVPGLGIDAAVGGVGIQEDGTLEVLGTADVVGWLASSAVPGRIGPSVIAGHVDAGEGPGVFSRLAELSPGDTIEVDLDDGSTQVFAVTGSQRVAKTRFPTDAVYGPSPTPRLRLVTCGGDYDREVRSYADNVIVDAVPVPAA